jgi:hypothetical protein
MTPEVPISFTNYVTSATYAERENESRRPYFVGRIAFGLVRAAVRGKFYFLVSSRDRR